MMVRSAWAIVLSMLAACSANHQRVAGETADGAVDAANAVADAGPDSTDDAALADASDDAALNDGTLADGMVDADAGPVDCDGGFQALDQTCVVDDDCALATRTRCATDTEGVSDVIGIAQTERAEFDRLAIACNVPTEPNDCPNWDLLGYAPTHVDEEISDVSHTLQAAVRCEAGRCVTHRTSCGPALCDNGVLDSCYITDSENGPVFAPTEYWSGHHPSELCDGHDLADQTCSSVGFGAGSLACVRGSCVFDYRGCRPCAPLSDKLTACVNDFVMDPVNDGLALAASFEETAVAWMSSAPSGVLDLNFALFSADLRQRSQEIVPAIGLTGHGLQLLPIPGGWVLAGVRANQTAVELHRFGGSGEYLGIARSFEGGLDVRLAARPSDAPGLMVMVLLNGWETHVLSWDGQLEALVSVGLPGRLDNRQISDAIWIGDGYLVAQTAFGQPFTLQRVEPNGSVVAAPAIFGVSPVPPALTYNNFFPMVAYQTPNNEVTIQRLASDGRPAVGASPVAVPLPSDGLARWVGWGGNALVAWRAAAGSLQVAQLRVDDVLAESIEVLSYPYLADVSALLHQGDHVIVATRGDTTGLSSAYPLVSSPFSLARIDP